jgi:hypothetical protein
VVAQTVDWLLPATLDYQFSVVNTGFVTVLTHQITFRVPVPTRIGSIDASISRRVGHFAYRYMYLP